jgi:hypothetical protein
VLEDRLLNTELSVEQSSRTVHYHGVSRSGWTVRLLDQRDDVGHWDHIRACLLGGRDDCSRAVLLYSVIWLSFATAPASAVAPQLYWCLAEYGGIAH